MAEQHQLRDEMVNRLLLRRFMPFLPSLVVIWLAVAFAHSAWPPTHGDLMLFLLSIPFIAIVVPIGLYRARDNWHGFTVELEDGRLRRRRPGVADQEWAIHEIHELGWTREGDLRVVGPSKAQRIQIPPEVDAFDQLLFHLGQSVAVSPRPVVGPALEFLLITCGMLGVAGTVLYGSDPRVLLAVGVVGTVASGKLIHGLLTDPNVASNMRHHAVHLVLPLILCLFTIARAIREWPG